MAFFELTRPQQALLRAIDAGHVADRHHPTLGWATRRIDRRHPFGPGGSLGLDVTAAAQRVREMGLAEPKAPADGDSGMNDRPWRLTLTGRLVLAAAAAKRRDRP